MPKESLYKKTERLKKATEEDQRIREENTAMLVEALRRKPPEESSRAN